MANIDTGEFYSAIMKSETMTFAGMWVELEAVVLEQIAQTKKDKYLMFLHMDSRCFMFTYVHI